VTLQRPLRLLAGIKGTYFKGRDGAERGRGGEGEENKRRGREERGREGSGGAPVCIYIFLRIAHASAYIVSGFPVAPKGLHGVSETGDSLFISITEFFALQKNPVYQLSADD